VRIDRVDRLVKLILAVWTGGFGRDRVRIAPVHWEAVCVVEQVVYRSAGELTGRSNFPEWPGGVRAAD
jgi:hypothetical protein